MASPLESSHSITNTVTGKSAGLSAELSLLSAQISQHEVSRKHETVLEAALDCIDPLAIAARVSLSMTEERVRQALKKNPALSDQQQNLLTVDMERARQQASSLSSMHHSAEPYLRDCIKTAAMFMRGRSGLVAAAVAFALAECKVDETPREQATDLLLGSLKGVGMKAVFSGAGELDPAMKLIPIKYNLPGRAALMAVSSRTIEVGLSRSTWVDPRNAELDIGRAAEIAGSQIFNPVALGNDLVAFSLSGGLVKGGNYITRGAVEKSPLLSTMLMGAGFGLSAGGSAELYRQKQANERLDLTKIASHAFTQGAVDAVAAIPGGKQADREAMRIFNNLSIDEPGASRATSAGRSPESRRLPVYPASESHEVNCSYLTPEEMEYRRLSIVPRPERWPADAYKQITAWRRSKESIVELRESNQGKSAGSNELVREAKEIEQPVRLYYTKGQNAEIMVPEKYAREHDQIRLKRIYHKEIFSLSALKRDFFDLALPEDFVARLEELPNNRLVQRVNILHHRKPNDFLKETDKSLITKADARPDGIMTFYRPLRYPDTLQEDVNHEWAHLLHHNLPRELSAFKAAAIKEKALPPDGSKNTEFTGFNARQYATTNEKENWAVHLGEELLSHDADRFLRTAGNAPLRSVILARALKWSLNNSPQPEKCAFRFQLKNRVDFIEQKIEAPAIEKLEKEVRQAKEPTEEQIVLLDYLSKRCNVGLLMDLAKGVTSFSAAKQIVNAVSRRLEGQPQAKLDALFELANPQYATRHDALESFTPTEIEQYYKPRLEELESKLPATDFNLLYRNRYLADLSSKLGNFRDAEILWYKALVAEGSIFGPAHELTAETGLELALSLTHQGKYAEARPYLELSLDVLTGSKSASLADKVRICANVLCDTYSKLGIHEPEDQVVNQARAYLLKHDYPAAASALEYKMSRLGKSCAHN